MGASTDTAAPSARGRSESRTDLGGRHWSLAGEGCWDEQRQSMEWVNPQGGCTARTTGIPQGNGDVRCAARLDRIRSAPALPHGAATGRHGIPKPPLSARGGCVRGCGARGKSGSWQLRGSGAREAEGDLPAASGEEPHVGEEAPVPGPALDQWASAQRGIPHGVAAHRARRRGAAGRQAAHNRHREGILLRAAAPRCATVPGMGVARPLLHAHLLGVWSEYGSARLHQGHATHDGLHAKPECARARDDRRLHVGGTRGGDAAAEEGGAAADGRAGVEAQRQMRVGPERRGAHAGDAHQHEGVRGEGA